MGPPGFSTDGSGTVRPATERTFRLFGVPIRFHFTFVLMLVFLLVLGFGGKQSGFATALYVLALFASVVVHELGHALVSSRYGIRTEEIVMFPIGGVARMERQPKPAEELWIALAGPFVNLLIAAVLFGLLGWKHQTIDIFDLAVANDTNLLQRIAIGNLVLAAFNLLPAFPMDGGRVLRSLLSRSRPESEATRIAAAAGRMLGIAMGLFGLLMAHFMLVFVAFFVYVGAAQEGMAAMGRSLTHGIPVKAAMVTDYHTLPHGSTVRDAADLLLSTSQQDFPVVHSGQVLGLLGRNALIRAMANEGPEAYVAGVMDRDYLRLSPEMDLADALPLMATAGSCALVMAGEDLKGLLTAENLSEFLLLRRVGMSPTVGV